MQAKITSELISPMMPDEQHYKCCDNFASTQCSRSSACICCCCPGRPKYDLSGADAKRQHPMTRSMQQPALLAPGNFCCHSDSAWLPMPVRFLLQMQTCSVMLCAKIISQSCTLFITAAQNCKRFLKPVQDQDKHRQTSRPLPLSQGHGHSLPQISQSWANFTVQGGTPRSSAFTFSDLERFRKLHISIPTISQSGRRACRHSGTLHPRAGVPASKKANSSSGPASHVCFVGAASRLFCHTHTAGRTYCK